ncbi:LLM class flavin-dependent oxidoreductase [Rhizorhabdus wittichii]|jgi:FMN-dependent oxidoreductase (nitrilotriacetate monooxygenase family)|uniref:LLM class flavin-dependent oxidoreductase n=1 Tax=Rhizorhabdus wittichii TaxID=160791 RepID=A0A975HD50_9SPHN|nr:LLM class flavin-dependent oxidoreductase [Rhizorhabdus wittichii]QTH20952.1 LLM class flavin-dependent oxidoreductase [Rhizorhabdus wittichii]
MDVKTDPAQLHLGVFVAAAGNHVAGWRIPGALTDTEDFGALLDIARVAERGRLDFVFFADSPVSSVKGNPTFIFGLEPTTLLGALAATTSRIGLIATVSSTFTEPYNLARAIGTVDRISGGRAGWNVVTTGQPGVAENFGRELPRHELRYQIADEYLKVVKGLWDSWESGARVADKATGRFIDESKLHVLNHVGDHYSVRGPLGLSRSPQGQPVIVQAGSSGSGQAFAAKHAEVIFTVQQDIDDAKAFYAGMKQQVAAAGRDPDHARILCGLYPVVGRTEQEARARFEELAALIEPGSALVTMSERFGFDLTQIPLDGPVPDLKPTETGQRSFLEVLCAKARKEGLRFKDIHDLFALSRGYLLLQGTPETIADTMEEWVRERACDGYILIPPFFPGAFTDFVDLVVPELQRRGSFRADYRGDTLRSHLGLPEPAHPHAVG